MGSSKNKEIIDRSNPEKIVIVAGPTFGSAIKFMLFGAALGAGAVFYLTQEKGAKATSADASLGGDETKESGKQLAARAASLAKRISALAVRAKDAAQSAKEAVAPAISEAVAAGKSAAQETEAELEAELKAEREKETEGQTSPEQPKVAAEQA